MIVLASQSTGRLATLRAAGIEPIVRVSQVDEPAVLAELGQAHARAGAAAPTAPQQVQTLARAKAMDVARLLRSQPTPVSPGPLPAAEVHPEPMAPSLPHQTTCTPLQDASNHPPMLVVGCDSMLEINGEVVGKPRTPQAARERWMAMRGRTGVLHTGHTVVRVHDGRWEEAVSSTVVHFGWPTAIEIDAYVATGEPVWCAGAFTVDGLGGAFIDGVEGDPHGVVGLSLPLLRRLVTTLGVRWTDLWSPTVGRSVPTPDRP